MAARIADVPYRISGIQEALLKMTALTLDGIGFLLMLTVVGEVGTEVIGFTGDALFFIWFFMLGVHFTGGNAKGKIVTMAANAIAEAIPFINGLYPGFSIAVWRMVSIVKKEDEEKAQAKTVQERAVEEKRAVELARANAVRAAQAQRAANDTEQVAEAA